LSVCSGSGEGNSEEFWLEKFAIIAAEIGIGIDFICQYRPDNVNAHRRGRHVHGILA